MTGPGQAVWEGGLFFKPAILGNQIGNVPIDLSKSSLFEMVAIGNLTLLNPTGIPGNSGALFAVAVTQDSNGSRAVSFGSAYLVAPDVVFSATPGSVDTILCQLLSTGSVKVIGVFNTDPAPGGLPNVFVGAPDNGTNQTLTTAMVTGGAFVTHLSTGGATPSLTMPLATAIIAAQGMEIGQSYVLRIINANSGTATIVTNTGITTTGTLTLATNTWREFSMTMTAAGAIAMVSIGTGTTS